MWPVQGVSGARCRLVENNDPMEKVRCMEKEKKKPIFRRRLGNVQVVVWPNESEKGEVWYNTT